MADFDLHPPVEEEEGHEPQLLCIEYYNDRNCIVAERYFVGDEDSVFRDVTYLRWKDPSLWDARYYASRPVSPGTEEYDTGMAAVLGRDNTPEDVPVMNTRLASTTPNDRRCSWSPVLLLIPLHLFFLVFVSLLFSR